MFCKAQGLSAESRETALSEVLSRDFLLLRTWGCGESPVSPGTGLWASYQGQLPQNLPSSSAYLVMSSLVGGYAKGNGAHVSILPLHGPSPIAKHVTNERRLGRKSGPLLWKMRSLPAASQGKWLLPVQTRECLLQLSLWEDPLQPREISGSLLMSAENRDQNQRDPVGWGSLKQMARCPPTSHCAQAQSK